MHNIIVIQIVLIAVIIYACKMLTVVKQHEKGIIESFGTYTRTAQSGLILVIPFFQTVRKVDMREQALNLNAQEFVTKDNNSLSMDILLYYQVLDPFKSVYNVANLHSSLADLARVSMRNILGRFQLDQALTSQDSISAQLRTTLAEATEKWGITVTRIAFEPVKKRMSTVPQIVPNMIR